MFDNDTGDDGKGERRPNPVDRHVGQKLAARRIALGRSQSDVARALGLSFQQVQKYERGSNRISASKLWEAAAYLDVAVGYFFEGLAGARPTEDEEESQYPVTRWSFEIARLSRRLSTDRQRLFLDILREISPRSIDHEP